jgi:hypothetical protein
MYQILSSFVVVNVMCTLTTGPGMLASLNRSWRSNEGMYCALGIAGIEPMPSEDWTLLWPKPLG